MWVTTGQDFLQVEIGEYVSTQMLGLCGVKGREKCEIERERGRERGGREREREGERGREGGGGGGGGERERTCVREKSHFLRRMGLSLEEDDEYSRM